MKRRWQVPLLAVALVGLGAAVRHVRLAAFEQHLAGQRYEDIYYLPDAPWLPVLSVGFRAALADLIWCKSLVYFGEELGHTGQVKFAFAYTDAVLSLDPSFRAAYTWIGTAALYRPKGAGLEVGRRAAQYLKRAVERWPNDGELRWDYGSLLRFELAPLERDPTRKRALLERAAPELEAAARLGAGPPWLALNNAALLNKLGHTDQAIRQLEEMHGMVQSDEVRRDIEAQLARLKTATYLEAMRVAEDDFERARRSSYPYLSPDLFYVVGEKLERAQYERYIGNGFLSRAEAEAPPLEAP